MRRNIHPCDRLIMAFEFVFEAKSSTGFLVQLDIVISSHSQRVSIRGKGMVGDWMVEEVMHFWGGHGESVNADPAVGGALYYRFARMTARSRSRLSKTAAST